MYINNIEQIPDTTYLQTCVHKSVLLGPFKELRVCTHHDVSANREYTNRVLYAHARKLSFKTVVVRKRQNKRPAYPLDVERRDGHRFRTLQPAVVVSFNRTTLHDDVEHTIPPTS